MDEWTMEIQHHNISNASFFSHIMELKACQHLDRPDQTTKTKKQKTKKPLQGFNCKLMDVNKLVFSAI
jgi:hypothetical protein